MKRQKTSSSSSSSSSGEQVRVRHLLIKHKDSRRPASWRSDNITITKEEARSQLTSLRTTIWEGAPSGDAEALEELFKSEASKRSDCSSAKRDGDLGFFKRGMMQKPFEVASFGLKVGELSNVVDTDSGLHIILRIG